MKTRHYLSGLTLLMILVGSAACGGRGEEATAEAPGTAETPGTTEVSGTTETVQEQSVVAYDNPTYGALQVRSLQKNPANWFEVLQNGKPALSGNPKLLNGTVELAPGTYEVGVNRTQRTVTIEAGKKTVLWTGELIVEGEPSGAFWYPMEDTERRLASNPPTLNSSINLFPGAYTVFVHVIVGQPDTNLGTAEVLAGRRTTLRHNAP